MGGTYVRIDRHALAGETSEIGKGQGRSLRFLRSRNARLSSRTRPACRFAGLRKRDPLSSSRRAPRGTRAFRRWDGEVVGVVSVLADRAQWECARPMRA